MQGQFLSDDDNSVSSPPIVKPNIAASSVAGEPKAPPAKPEGEFLPDDPNTPATSTQPKAPGSIPTGQFLDSPSQEAALTAPEMHSMMAQGWKPWTDEHFRTLYNEELNTPALTKVGAALKGVVSPFAKIPGEIAAVPADWKTHARAKRIAASIPEGVVGAAEGLSSLVGMPIAEDVAAGRVPFPFGSYIRGALSSPQDRYQEWKLNYLQQHPELSVNPSAYPTATTPDVLRGGVQPLPNTSAAISTLASFALPEGAVGAASKLAKLKALQPIVEAGEIAKGIPAAAVKGAYEATGLPKVIPTGTLATAFPKVQAAVKSMVPAPGAVGRAVSKAGDALNYLGNIPGRASEASTRVILGPELAEKLGDAVNAGDLPAAAAATVLGHPAVGAGLASFKAMQKAAPVVKGIGDFMERYAQAEPGYFGKLYTLAKYSTAPSWMRALSDNWALKSMSAAAQGAGDLAKAGASGAAFGAGIGMLPGQDLASNVGAGLGYGLVGGGLYRGRQKEARLLQANMDSIKNFTDAHLADGIPMETLAKVPTSALTWGSAAEQMFGNGMKVRFAGEGEGSPLPQHVYGQGGFYDPTTKTAWINVDSTRPADETVLHEMMHPLFDSAVADQPALKNVVNQSLQDNGKTLDQAKQEYASALLSKRMENIPNDVLRQNFLEQQVKQMDEASQAQYGDPDAWIHSELLAEAATQSLYGKHPVTDVINPSITQAALQPVADMFQKMGVKFNEKPGTVFPGFENVIDTPAMRKAVYKLLKDQKNTRLGQGEITPKATPVEGKMVGQHPSLPVRDLGNGQRGNDLFKETKPGSGKFELRPVREQKAISKKRSDVLNTLYPKKGEPLPATDESPGMAWRRTPSGLVERSGKTLGDEFQNVASFGSDTKAAVKLLENTIKNGGSIKGWLQQIGKHGEEFRASVARDLGNVEVEFKHDFYPTDFVLSDKGNLLVRGHDFGPSTEAKLENWSNRTGPVSLESLGGDAGKFRQLVSQYLKNHAEGQPGEANGVGEKNRDLVNAFIVGGNRSFGEKNPLRKFLKGADRQGIIRSYRLDRLETVEQDTGELSKPSYKQQLHNMSPETQTAEPKTVQPEKREIEITGPDGKKYKARFDGYQDFSALGKGRVPQITALEDIPGVVIKHSTTYVPSLEKKGYTVPDLTERNPAELHAQELLQPNGRYSPPTDTNKEHITTAALEMPDGKTFEGPVHMMAAMWAEAGGYNLFEPGIREGFMTSKGRFVDRLEAKKLAMGAGQIDARKAILFDKQFGEGSVGKTLSGQTPLEAIAFNHTKAYSPELESRLAKIPGAKASEMPEGEHASGNYWLTKDGRFINIPHHESLPAMVGANSVFDLYKAGLRRVVINPETMEGKPVVNVSGAQHDTSLSAKQQQALETMKDKGFPVRQDAGSRFSPETPGFKKWAGKTPIIDENEPHKLYDLPGGKPVVITGFHGTTHDFSVFDTSKGNPENDWGRGIYMTTEPEDVAHNYAGKGPDLTSRIEQRTEQILNEKNKDYDDKKAYAAAKRQATKELSTHEGATMKLYAKLENPLKVGGGNEERWDLDYPKVEYAKGQHNPNPEELDYENPQGKMVDFVEALRSASHNFNDVDGDKLNSLIGELHERGMDGIPASRVLDMVRKSEAITYATDDQGHMASSELIRQALEKMGYDGIIDTTVDKKFGSGSGRTRPMAGMNPDTVHVIAFKPESVKSATGNNGKYNPKNPDIRYSPTPGARTGKVFSQAEKVIDEKFSGESMPKSQLAAVLRNPQNGIKPEEMKWSGLDDFLKGEGRVTKEEIKNFLDLNNVQVKEVNPSEKQGATEVDFDDGEQIEPDHSTVKESAKDYFYDDIHTELKDEWDKEEKEYSEKELEKAAMEKAIEKAYESEYENAGWRWVDQTHGYEIVLNSGDDGTISLMSPNGRHIDDFSNSRDGMRDAMRDAKKAAQEHADENYVNDPEPDEEGKYGSHTLPGGENYEEMLFTLPGLKNKSSIMPPRPLTDLPEGYVYIRDSSGTPGKEWGVIKESQGHARPLEGFWYPDQEEAKKAAINYLNFQRQSEYHAQRSLLEKPYKSGHWEEENILAHARIKDRQDVDGRDGLFIEEIQSDWHQAGRRAGYREPGLTGEALDTAEKQLLKLNGEMSKLASEMDGRKESENTEARQTYDKLMAERNKLSEKMQGKSGVPDAPFKNTWHEMVFRRLLNKAVKEGNHWLGWTTGEQQGDRYNLAKRVKMISAMQESKGKYLLYIEGLEGGPAFRNQHGFSDQGQKTVTKEQIDDLIGTEATRLITAGADARAETPLPGEKGKWYDSTPGDLKVGGSGMRGFYDKLLVDYANKFGKKFGVRVHDIEIPTEREDTEVIHALPINSEMTKSLRETGVSLFSPELSPQQHRAIGQHMTKALGRPVSPIDVAAYISHLRTGKNNEPNSDKQTAGKAPAK